MSQARTMSRFETTAVLCGGCQAVFGGRVVVEIDAMGDRGLLERIVDDGVAALNPLSCPACGWRYAAAAPVLVHGLVIGPLLVLPTGARHTLRAAQGAALQRLLPPESATGALSPTLQVVGDDNPRLATLLLGEPTITAPRDADGALAALADSAAPDAVDDSPLDPIDAGPIDADPIDRAPIDRAPIDDSPTDAWPAAESSAPPAPTDAWPAAQSKPPAAPTGFSAPPIAAPPIEAPPIEAIEPPISAPVGPAPAPALEPLAAAAPDSEAGAENLLAELLSARPAAASAPRASLADEPESSSEAWEAIGEGWSLQAVPARPDNDPTHVVSLDEIDGAPPGGPAFAAPAGVDRHLVFEDGHRLVAAARIPDAAATQYDGQATLRFQLHSTPMGPIAGLIFIARDADGAPQTHVFWPIDDGTEQGADILDSLARDFAVEVRLYVDPTGPALRKQIALPLEQNVSAARSHLATHPGDRAAAISTVLTRDFDRVGRLRHNFQADSFDDLTSAAEARLAIGILGYWSAPERQDYLLRVKSFPVPWFEAITRRVLEAAVHFGLAMEPPMRQRSFELKLASSSATLLRRLLANFAEVNLNLRPCGLDVFDIWDNWEALLAHAEELDLRVDEEIEELAARAMERARNAAQAAEPLEIHLSEESIELEEVIELDELSDEGLVASLARPEQRLDAARVLLQRGGTVHVPAIFDALVAMPREELLDAVPAALAKGPAFETHFLGALHARRTSLRLAAALFLSEIRSERALTPLLALLPSADESEWPVLSRAAARMGRRIIGPTLDLVESEGDRDGRLAHTLALLGGDARGALAAASDQRTDPRVRACLSAAISQMNAVSFGDAADFGERLADAFAAAGPDRVSPEFSEVLESIDLGPGASVSGIDADVNLDLDD